jgi:hypothetical protein
MYKNIFKQPNFYLCGLLFDKLRWYNHAMKEKTERHEQNK